MIGAGRMGSHHARILATLDGARLAGVYDKHPERGAELAKSHGTRAFAALEDVVGACDAAVVATSSPAHLAVGRALLEAGIACLIEKPLALNEADCLALIASAARRGVPLAVGHTERFNPATVALMTTIAGWRVRAIETRRLNPGSARVTDTGVVSDLMLHDLDIVLQIMGRSPSDVVAIGTTADPRAGADHAIALLSFTGAADGPALASCAASRITAHRARELTLVGDRGSVMVNYLTRSVGVLAPGGAEPTPVAVAEADALTAELGAFVDTVRDAGPGRGRIIDGAAALAALRLAWSIEQQIARR